MQAWLRANSRWTPFSNQKVNSQSSIPHHSIVPMHISANPLHQRTRWRLPHVDFVRLHKATSTFNGIGSRQLAAEFGVGKTQINNIVAAKADILKLWDDGVNGTGDKSLTESFMRRKC